MAKRSPEEAMKEREEIMKAIEELAAEIKTDSRDRKWYLDLCRVFTHVRQVRFMQGGVP